MSDEIVEVPVRLPRWLFNRLLRVVLWKKLLWDEAIGLALLQFLSLSEKEYKEKYGVPIDP
jgi:hypothetical protein